MSSTGNDDGLPTTITDTGLVIFRGSAGSFGPAAMSVAIPTPTGACCVGSTCELRPRFDCDRPGASFSGAGTSCTSATVSYSASCCIADFDQNGVVSQSDLFGFIGAWIGQDRIADADHNGTIGLSDLTTYIGEYSSGCPGHTDVSIGRR
jgi:hypothetical protein